MDTVKPWMNGPLLARERTVEALESVIQSGDSIVMEGDNQKQADFLSRSLVKVDPKKIHDLHLIISSISRPEHLTLFELGIAKKVDFAFAGPQSLRVAQLLEDGVLEIGAIHTYIELYARLLVDLVPNVVLVCAERQIRQGNLFTGPNTEDTPVIVEAAAFHDAIVDCAGQPGSSTGFHGSIFRRPGWTSWSKPIDRLQSSRSSPVTPVTSPSFRFSPE